MKKILFTAVFSVVAVGGFIGVKTLAQSGPIKVAAIDLEVLKRTEAQLQSLQLRLQAEAGPIIKEHDDVYVRYCSKAGLQVGQGGNCQINTQTGEVQKIQATTPFQAPKK